MQKGEEERERERGRTGGMISLNAWLRFFKSKWGESEMARKSVVTRLPLEAWRVGGGGTRGRSRAGEGRGRGKLGPKAGDERDGGKGRKGGTDKLNVLQAAAAGLTMSRLKGRECQLGGRQMTTTAGRGVVVGARPSRAEASEARGEREDDERRRTPERSPA